MIAVLSRTQNLAGHSDIKVTGSKSESNRLLILKGLYPGITIKNLSHSDDSVVLTKALSSGAGEIDIHHAGTAMRFLTAYFATQKDANVLLTGSSRMQERPIGILVDALRSLGAEITYEKEPGFPPLRIHGKTLKKNKVIVAANVSSQYISALMLIAPSLPKGLTIEMDGVITSIPYINMTLALLHQIGVEAVFSNNCIRIQPKSTVENRAVTVESDWSSASYFYSIVALSTDASITISSYKKNSLQGDAALVELYSKLGVLTTFDEEKDSITLSKNKNFIPQGISFNLVDTPDIAQTIAVSCFGLGIACDLTGLHTLKIKETDRLKALQNELEKLGASVKVTNDSLQLAPREMIQQDVEIATYHDHRMAMAFAP
nr:3-phosphoshikimate 1-carboxyvinyltransferase [Bacteroidota bacterium]